MKIDSSSGLMDRARFVRSPNCDPRPDGFEIEVLVIHAISLPPGKFGGPGIEQLFCNALDPEEHSYDRDICDLRVSAHLLIRRDGEVLQFVPFHKRAWHAGESCCEGRGRVNDFSIGIELEGCDDMPFTTVQYRVLTPVTRAIMKTYTAVRRERIFGHNDIAPERKTDPGPNFDWGRYLGSL